MSVPFGFSAGDIIAALELVATIIDALQDSGESRHRYLELIGELQSLERALLNVKRIELHESQNTERIALQYAAASCQRTIDEFWKKIEKYQPYLGNNGCGSRLKQQWARVKWSIFKEKDVDKFKADLGGHTAAITILLLATQRLDLDKQMAQPS